MPWQQTEPVTERTRFILAYEDGLFSMHELCTRFCISRKTGYKWLGRYRAEGLAGLNDQNKRPKHCPHQTDPKVEALLVAARKSHPRWGARKLIAYVARRNPDIALPAPSTASAILKRHGLIDSRRKRRRGRHPGTTPLETSAPNQVWGADFKGQFLMGNGIYCYPLTVTDAHSRYILSCKGLPSVKQKGTFPVFEGLFYNYGLPDAIRTDNGVPFATTAICGLSKLSVWWIKLGIDHQRIEPGQPQQNGRHERMHRTLKAETTRPPERNMKRQQKRFDAFTEEFNQERPHEALDYETPSVNYNPSLRPMPAALPKPQYPAHFEVRLLSKDGNIRFKNRQFRVSGALAHERLGLEEVDDGVWSMYFYDVLLARLDERDFKVKAASR